MLAKQPTPRVVLVIVNKNGHPYVYDCVRSVLNTEYRPFEVVFFDNASVDGSYLIVKEICARKDNVLFLRSPREISLARATNLAVDAASSNAEYIGFLDSDVVVTPGLACSARGYRGIESKHRSLPVTTGTGRAARYDRWDWRFRGLPRARDVEAFRYEDNPS